MRESKKPRNPIIAFILGLAASLLFLTSCGQYGNRSIQSKGSAITGDILPSDCVNLFSPNVQAQEYIHEDYQYNGTMDFYVCAEEEAPSDLLIAPAAELENEVFCFFPVSDNGHSFPSGTGNYTCDYVPSEGLLVNLGSTAFDSVIVTTFQDSSAWALCLQSNTPYTCPKNWSYGSVSYEGIRQEGEKGYEL